MKSRNFGVLTALAACCLIMSSGSSGAAGASASVAAATSGIVRLDSAVKLTEFKSQSRLAVPGHPAPPGAGKQLFAGAGGMHIGVWESGPGVLRVIDYPHDEYCVMLFGVLTITSESGRSETFHTGDSFVIPKGFNGIWDMKTKMRKQYAYVSAAR